MSVLCRLPFRAAPNALLRNPRTRARVYVSLSQYNKRSVPTPAFTTVDIKMSRMPWCNGSTTRRNIYKSRRAANQQGECGQEPKATHPGGRRGFMLWNSCSLHMHVRLLHSRDDVDIVLAIHSERPRISPTCAHTTAPIPAWKPSSNQSQSVSTEATCLLVYHHPTVTAPSAVTAPTALLGIKTWVRKGKKQFQ